MSESIVAAAAAASRSLHRPPSPQDHRSWRSLLPLLRLEYKKFSFSWPSISIASIGGDAASVAAVAAASGTTTWSSEEPPTSVELEPIVSEDQFNRIIAEAHQLEEPVVVLWMASWCRKCIYLKPKLEKLAADYYPRIRFYSIDVNTIPHRLVNRAGVTKMPTVQLWRDSKIQGEVIAGYKAWMVIDDVRKMIENND
ncbi:hypothetical protein Cni_G03611 [Canna indica]|uniref:Thioredoxin domain-containing protein n=1 Tax=Canna indica TaxID=4628 RepID=A0AAQ3JS74_9LILI|nr:hypothetical protein Cni_G03611 [Canna indica]